MLKYIIVRLIWMVIVVFFIISILFVISDIVFINHIQLRYYSAHKVQFILLDYISFLKRMVTKWEWGYTATGFPVWSYFKERLPNSIKINIFAFLFYIPSSIILGTISAIKKNSKTDRFIAAVTLTLGSIPGFIMIFVLMIIFSYKLQWFPSIYPPKIATTYIRFKGLFIPMIAISLMPLAQLTRLVRGELTETLESEYLLLVRSKGLTKRQAIIRHAFRNSIVPILPAISTIFVSVLMGSFLVEYIYNVPGIASFFFEGFISPLFDTHYININTDILILVCGFYSIISLLFAFIVDVTYKFLDPRLKIGSTK